MNEEQIKLLTDNDYKESINKSGLWYKFNDIVGTATGWVIFIDIRGRPHTYGFQENENIPGDTRLLRRLKLIGDKNQSRLL